VKWACWLVLLSPLLVGLLLALWQPALLLSMYEDRGWNLEQRLWSQARVLWQYVGWFFYPDIRGMGLHHDDFQVSAGWLQPFSTLPAVVGWLCLLAALLLRWRVWPLPLLAAGLFLLSHAGEANVIPLEMVYEHRNYLGGLGLSLLLAWCLWIVVPMATPRPRLFVTAAVGLLLSLLLLARTSLWSDELEMAEFHLYYHPQSLRSVYHYANTRLRLGEASVDQEQAQEHLLAARRYYRRMLEIDQEDVAALVTLQYLDGRYFSSLDSPEWRQRLLAAVRDRTIGKADINALNLLFDCEARGYCGDEGESSEALLLMLADRYPTQVRYRDLLARLYGQVRADYARAIKLHQGIVDTNPDYLPAHYGLIAWYTRSGQHGQALQAIGRLLEADPSGRSLQRIQLMFSTGARG
jgi:tetratricopeptide (TPR) repeat protein